MAKPIEPTPILTHKDADRLYKEAEEKVVLSSEKIKQLERCASLYTKFYSRADQE